MKKLYTLFMTALLLAGCSTTEEGTEPSTGEGNANGDANEELVVYGIYKAGDQTWFLDEGAEARRVVEDAGGEFIYVDAQMNPEEYLRAIDNAIANNATGIVTTIPDQTMSQAVIDTVKNAGIPIVAADDALQDENGELLAPWVGIDAYNIGEANGEWLANYVNENELLGEEVGYMILTMDTVSSVVPRTEGQYAKFTEIATEFDTEKIYHADYDGTTDLGYQAASSLMTAHPEVKTWLVTTGNEEGAIGALRAIEEAGLEDTSVVIGLGAYLAKDEWNKNSDNTAMKAATYFSAQQIGAGSIEVLFDLIDEKEVPMETAVEATMVTPENYKEVMGTYAE